MFAPSKKAGHMGATDQLCMTMQKVLANRVPRKWVPHGAEQRGRELRRAPRQLIEIASVQLLISSFDSAIPRFYSWHPSHFLGASDTALMLARGRPANPTRICGEPAGCAGRMRGRCAAGVISPLDAPTATDNADHGQGLVADTRAALRRRSPRRVMAGARQRARRDHRNPLA